ncbi:thioredoxin family protein [Streptomyces sp. NPDC060005]|uniref:thioredoxin family protein n=1 Tax=Streptomyces sp. NPDC060005 TaxID=3347034 RepID=UPI00369EBE0C
MSRTVEVTKDNFNEIVEGNELVIFDFWASWCGPCQQFALVYDAAAEQNLDVVFGKVDTEAQPELAEAFDIRSIPTLMVVRDQTTVFSQPGALPAETLAEVIDRARHVRLDEDRPAPQ